MKHVALILCILLGTTVPAQEGGHPKVDQKRVDAAVEKGGDYLMSQVSGGLKIVNHSYHGPYGIEELVLYTVLHAGVDTQSDTFKKLVDAVLAKKFRTTYEVSLRAMALQALDPVTYRVPLATCAQFLVDSQCKNGQWGYWPDFELPPVAVTKSREEKSGSSTKARRRVTIRRTRNGSNAGDNSNSQYAALGLRACMEADVVIPRETFVLGLSWWEKAHGKEGGWGYDINGNRAGDEYGTMTAGAVGASVIFRHYLKLDFKKDPKICAGIRWMDENFSVEGTPKYHASPLYQFYWLYALERVGMLYETENLGKHEWYPEGAEWLLSHQKEDGSWHQPVGQAGKMTNVWGPVGDSCFAILFLRRATRPLRNVATGAGKKSE